MGKQCFGEFEKRDHVCSHCPGTRALATGQPAEAETEGVRDDGSRFFVRIQAFPILGADGQAEAFIEVVENTTDRKRAEESLRESEERFRQVFENMAGCVALYRAVNEGQDFVFVDMNPAAQHSSRIGREEVIGRRITEVFPGVKEMGLLDVLRRVWKTGQPELHPQALYHDQRIELWAENYVCRLPSGLLAAIYEDITTRKKAEAALAEETARRRILFEQRPTGSSFWILRPLASWSSIPRPTSNWDTLARNSPH